MSSVFRSVFGLLLLVLSAPLFSQVTAAPLPERPYVPNNRWALVIGVSGYSEQIGALKYTASEAQEFSGFLTRNLAFEPENVRLLADNGKSQVVPTSANILTALDSLLADKRLDRANLFVFYFSGHGVGTPKGDFLLPADAEKGKFEEQGVPVREVIGKIVNAGLKNVLFIADACRAGTQNDFGEDLTALCHKANIAVILGCSPGKRSYEYPELRQGAFTHFLLEGLKNPSLRDASGALWASRLGQDVQTKVHDFTEPDHGKFAQVPALWAETSTLDVLLAAYPQESITAESVKQFQVTASRLDRKDYASALIAYATALFEKDRRGETVEMLKTVDALGELTPGARFDYAVALSMLGRKGEAERNFESMATLEPGFWRDMGIAMSSSRKIPPEARIQSAANLFATANSWGIANVAYDVIDQWGTSEQRHHYAELLTKVDPTSARHHNYSAGLLAASEGRWSDAVAAYDKAFLAPGELPYDETIEAHEFRAVATLHNDQALDAFFARHPVEGLFVGLDDVARATQAKVRGDRNERVASLKRALAKDVNPDILFLAAQTAGLWIGELDKEFSAAAARHPYSWRAQCVLYILATVRDDKVAMKDHLSAIDKYLDDPMTLEMSTYAFMDDFLKEGVDLGRVPATVYRSQLEFYFFRLRNYLDKFGFDPDAWEAFIRYGIQCDRSGQTEQMVAAYLKFTPETTPKALRPILATLAINRGDPASAKRYFSAGYAADEDQIPTWNYAMFQVMHGNDKEAAKLVKGLTVPKNLTGVRVEALRTYLLAAGGDRARAKKRLATPSKDPIAQAIDGLTWVCLGDWSRAEPLLAAQSKIKNNFYLFVQEHALQVLDARYRATNRVALAKRLAFFGSVEEPGNPLFDHFVIGDKPGKAQFAGRLVMPCSLRDDAAAIEVKGTVTFTCDSAGVFTARMLGSGGETVTLTGKVDDYGNVRGSGTYKGKRYKFGAKIASAKEYRSYEKSGAAAQIIQMIDDDGLRVDLLGWPRGWPAGITAP